MMRVSKVPSGRRLLMSVGVLPAVVACCGGIDPVDPVDPAAPAPVYVTDEATYLARAVPNVDPPTVLVVILEAGPMLVAVNVTADGQEADVIEQGPAERCDSYGGTFHPYEGRPGECDGVDY